MKRKPPSRPIDDITAGEAVLTVILVGSILLFFAIVGSRG